MAFGDRLGERAPKIFLRVDIQPDVIRPAMGHDSGEDKGGNGRDGADGDPGAVRGDILYLLQSLVGLADDPAGPLQEGFARVGQHSLAAKPMKERLSELSLKVEDLLAE
ncbi:MAG TPA: hypothetical protein PLQ52_04460 [Lacunisphaera sp.]|nr:hypothetical protein [Lacunisphaera sp.]